MFRSIEFSVAPNGVATLALNRPQASNAFDANTIAEMLSAIAQAESSPAVRVLLIKGNGKHFSAGADLNWMRSMADMTEAENIQDAGQLAKLMKAIHDFPKPTIAQVQGSAFGGATGLIACCDIAIASDDSRYCFSEVKLGLIPAVISPYVIRAIGARHASKLFLTAEVFSAQLAQDIGLVHAIGTADELQICVANTVNQLLANAPVALGKAKALIHHVDSGPLDDNMVRHTVEAIANIRISEEGREGLRAFLEKRTPAWMRTCNE